MTIAPARPVVLTPRVRTLLADLETPVAAFAKLRHLGGAFLFESVEVGERIGRYSFIGVAPFATFTYADGSATIEEPAGTRIVAGGDPLALLRKFIGGYTREPLPGSPPFSGGAVGYIGYGLARLLEPTVPGHAVEVDGLPDLRFALYDTVVAFDHLRRTLTIIAHDVAGTPARAAERIAEVVVALDGRPRLPAEPPVERVVRSNTSPEEFVARVKRARALIREGDCIQVVLSQRFDVTPTPEPLSLYRAVRHVNPSPYLFYLDCAGATLVGASPEPFVRVRDGQVVMHPIAGTRPRGEDEIADRRLEAELLASEKERSEHVMLVDLARNDIGRVAVPGSVVVRELMRVDRFSHVMHLTSVVEGTLRPELDALDAVRAAFPAGTVSGAPKVRAMQRIVELEPDARGPYAGAVGYLGFDGSLDTCLAIRTAVVSGGVCRIQAGAGIVADSDPEAEEAETRAKARAMLRAVELVGEMDAGR